MPRPIQLRRARSGKIAVLTALLLVVFIGVLACALDTGWMTMTKTQLRAATDSGALAGGTELLPGLGFSAYKTPSEVQAAAVPQSVAYAAENRAGDQLAVYIDGGRDVSMGTGKLNTATGVWEFNWGSTPYNAVRVTGHRDVDGSGNGDEPLPLFAAPVIGTDVANLTVFSTAVILPASGISIPPGSGIGSGLTPFAFERARWDKYFRAQDYYENQLGSDPSLITEDIMDTGTGGNSEEMLFFEWVASGHGNSQHLVLKQMFDDGFSVVDPSLQTPDNIVTGPDGTLETNIYPISSTEGNFGTVDIGGLDNSTNVIKRQIAYGPNEEDLSHHENHEINPDDASPVTLQGDTGISAGIENTIESIIGQCRSILLYSVVSNPGNNAEYQIVDMVGTRWMYVNFSGNNKRLVIQPCSYSEPAGVPNFDDDIRDDTTLFTPLLLAQ